MDPTDSNGNCQLNITSPIPSTRQRYGLYLPPPTPSPELTPLTSPIITNSSTPTTLVDSKQNTLTITQERRETPEGFVLPYTTENTTSRTNSSSEAETSFLSPTPNNKSYVLTKTLTSDNSIRNVKSSIDLMKDINEENLMSHRSKCFTPEVHISPPLASSSVSNSVKNNSISGTLESSSKNPAKSITASDFDTVQENPDVLKWDYAGDLASNRLDISRINSQLNISSSSCCSSRPINLPIDYIDYDTSVALTWPSSGVHLSPPSRYGYLLHRKCNFNRTLNHNNLCNYFLRKNRYGIKIETGLSTTALSAGVLNQGSFISSPDPEDDEAVYNSLPLHSGDNPLSAYKYHNRYRHDHHGYQGQHHHYSQSPINFHDILDDDLESDENSQKLTSKTSNSNDHLQEHREGEEEDKEGTDDNDNDDDKTNDCDEMKFELPTESVFNTNENNTVNVTLNQICLNTSESVTELQNFANRILKATEAAEEQLRQRINHLSAVMDKTIVSDSKFQEEKSIDKPPEPRARTSLACQSIGCTDGAPYQSLRRDDNKQEDTLILQPSTKINHTITNDTNNEILDNNNEEDLQILQSVLQQQQQQREEAGEHQSEEDQQQQEQQQQNDLSSLWTTSISDRTDASVPSFAYITNDAHMKDVQKQQQQQQSLLIQSTDLPRLPLLDHSDGETEETVSYLTPPEDAQHIQEGIQTPRQDPANYSAITTITPMNENLHCETGGYVVGVESCRSSIIVDGNFDREVFAYPVSNEAVGHSLLNYAELQTINTGMPISQSILPIDNSQILIPCREGKINQNENVSATEEQHKIESSGENSNFRSICISTSGNADHLAATTFHNVQPFQKSLQSSSFPTNNESAVELYEYIPSRYTGLSTSDVQLLHLDQICQSLPTCNALLNSTTETTITIRPDTNQLSFNTAEQKPINDLPKQSQVNSISENMIGSVTKKSVIDPFCLNSDERSSQSSVVHHQRRYQHHVQPNSYNQTMNSFPPPSIMNAKSQDDDNNGQPDNNHLTNHEAYSCRNHIDDGFSSVLLTSPVSAKRPPLPERQTVENDLHVSKTLCYSTFTLNNEFTNTNTVKKSNTKMVQTGDLSVETAGVGGGDGGGSTCPATYRLESEHCEHLKQESNSRVKLDEFRKMKEYANDADPSIPEKCTNSGVLPSEYTPTPPPPHPTTTTSTTPRSTLVAQLRYSLLKQKLKLLRARDAYYLRRRIVGHLEKFLDQAITSDSCISLPNSIPEDWDTDTASVLSDLFDDNGGNFNKSCVHHTIPEFNHFKNSHSDNMIKSSERKSTIDKCVFCPDKKHSTQEENVQRKESKSAMKKSCFSQDDCCQRDFTGDLKACTQEGDNSGNRQAKSNSSPVVHKKFQCDRKTTTTTTTTQQFADLKKRAEHQLGEMIMKLKTNQSDDSPSQSQHYPVHVCTVKTVDQYLLSYADRQSSKYTPIAPKLFVAEACAASGGISWFQPLNQNRFNNIESRSARDKQRSNIKCLYREIPCRFASSLNRSIVNNNDQLGRKSSVAANYCVHTSHNHAHNHNGGGFCDDTESNDESSTAKQKSSSSEAEEAEVEEDDNDEKEKPETLKSSLLTNMKCCNQHQQQDTESFSSNIITDGVDLHPGQKNSPISKRITYEIGDNIYGAESIQTLFRKRMSAWISRSEERQKRLHLASAERRYQKAMDMERTQLFHPTLSDQYMRRPLNSHLSKVNPCHCGADCGGVGEGGGGGRSTWRDISNCCVHCSRNSNNQTVQSNRSNNGGDSHCTNPMSARRDIRQASVNLPSHRSTVSYKSNSGRRSARSGNETRSYRNYVQNQVYIQESKLAQLRVNRLRMKIYGEKILRSVLQRRGPWSMTFKEI
ncbi:unnamed protein product [Trichobilharzia szidati]|nr:unnamed protein product [Trichobilharzia szidati]